MLYHNFSLVFPGRIGYNVLQNNGWKNGKEEPDMMRQMFSLIELLVTVAVIAILAGLLLPALNSARQKGQAIRCVSNLKQQGNCHSLYAADFDDWIIGEQGDYGEASNYYVYYWWRKFRLLGYTGEKLRQYEDLKGPAGQNGIFVCPSQSYVTGMDRWSYGLNGHLGGCGAGVSHTNSGESAVLLLDPGALQYQQHRARFADLQKTEKKASGSVLAADAAASYFGAWVNPSNDPFAEDNTCQFRVRIRHGGRTACFLYADLHAQIAKGPYLGKVFDMVNE